MMHHWDQWEIEARQKGVAAELAALGRQVMRDHFQHGKEDHLLGAEGDWDEMIAMCLRNPDAAQARFEEELDGDDRET